MKIENAYGYWILLFSLEDLAFYFEHRVDHYCRVFWAVHVTHHSSTKLNFSTAFRQSMTYPISGMWMF
jgi:sterol desaturase/sphingolipid hydroxylase (fatty acid hydroxylase superfamily)